MENMTGKRLPDWEGRLVAYLSDHARDPFRYGRLDCALFTAGAIEAMTGVDHARGFRGYRTLQAGMKKVQDKGFEDHVGVVAGLFQEIAPAFAQPGDIAVIQGDDGPALGIVQGEAVYVLRRADGESRLPALGLVPLLSAVKAFRV